MTAKKREIAVVITKGMLPDGPDPELLDYWLSRPMAERIAHIEELRRDHHGDDYETLDRLPRSALRLECVPRLSISSSEDVPWAPNARMEK